MPTITIKKQRFARALAAILIAAGDDYTRPHIAQVQCWQAGDQFKLAGTDGHWAAVWTEIVGCDADTTRIGIARSDAEFLAGVLALDKPDDAEQADGEEIELQLGPGIAIECDRWTVRLPDTYLQDSAPDIDRIVSGTKRGEIPCISLSPVIVADVRKAFKVCGSLKAEAEKIEWGFGPTEVSPVLVTSSAVIELACVVMPLCPADVDVQEVGGVVRYTRRDTGEVLHSEPISQQQYIVGTEPDPVKVSGERLQAAVDAADVPINVHLDGAKIAELKPRKRGKP